MSLTALAFVLVFFGLGMLAFARHPIYGLWMYLLAFYGAPEARWWGGGSSGPALVTNRRGRRVGCRRQAATRRARRAAVHHRAGVCLILFTVWLWIQLLWAIDPPAHQFLAVLYTKYIVLFYLLFRLLDDLGSVWNFLIAHVIGGAYFGWLAFERDIGGRVEGIGGPALKDANAFATHLVVVLFFASVLLLALRGSRRVAVFLCIPFVLNAIISTQSRSGFVALLAGGICFLYLKPPGYRKTIYLLSFLAVCLFGWLASQTFWNRMDTLRVATENPEEASASRVALFYAQVAMYKTKPILGYGHRGTQELSPLYLNARHMTRVGAGRLARSSHNTVMTIVVEHGIPGIVLMVALFCWMVVKLQSMKSLDKAGLPFEYGLCRAGVGAAMGSLLVAMQFVDYMRVETVMWCVILVAVLAKLLPAAVTSASFGPQGRCTRGRAA